MSANEIFNYIINQKVLEIPSETFNINPQKAIMSLMGNQCDILYYKVNNLVTHEGGLLVKIYYKMLDISKIYIIKTTDLEQYKLSNTTQNIYIINNVKIILSPKDLKRPVVPIQLIPKDKPDSFVEIRSDTTNYFGRVKATTNRYFTSLTPYTLNALNEKVNSLTNVEVDSMIKFIYSKVDPEEVSVENLEKIMKSFLKITVSKYSNAIKQITELKYVEKIPDIPPKSINLAYITKFNEEFKKYIQNYHIGFILATDNRPTPDIVLYIPLMNHNITDEQLKNFTGNILTDVINAKTYLELI